MTIAEIKGLLDTLSTKQRIELFSALERDNRTGVRNLAASCKAQLAREEAEIDRLALMLKYESKLIAQGFNLVAGVDEVGRGALAGPIVAAAVILPHGCRLRGVRDSKTLTPERREKLYGDITAEAVAWNVARVENTDIDSFGIQWANMKVLELAVRGLNPAPDYVLSDAFTIRTLEIPHVAIIKGDASSLSIAAASIVAKVTRDRLMCDLHDEYPQYGFATHKGYGTPLHLTTLGQYGPTDLHRRCFSPVAEYEQLTF